MKDGITLDIEVFRCNGHYEAVIGDPDHATALRGKGGTIPQAISLLGLDAAAHPEYLAMHVADAEKAS